PTMEPNMKHVTNLVNSIIGVSVLAMPFCMKKCGLILGIGLLLGAAWLTNISCNMLVAAAQVKRRRTYEYLAFYTIGGSGKFVVELSMIGLMLGTCVAFYVIIGDLATGILSTMVEGNHQHLRTFVIIFCGLCIALPLGLMKNLSSLSSIGMFSLIFYMSFVCVMFYQAVSNGLLTLTWLYEVELFKPAGIFQCLPIFSLAYACQCQLFVVYDSMEEPSVIRMENIVSSSLKIVSAVYCLVALFGYSVFKGDVQGNVLRNFPQSLLLDIIKFGFALSVVVGFPLMIFPCRQSIYTLFFKPQPVEGIASKTFIEPFTFKAITLSIVLSTMLLAISIPDVETILGLTGATMGSFICFIFPGIIYSKALKD
uniref:Amino acid transporter transmembrane domain-containing protein n=1 Tax=Ciona savignyi TaxID=51511 RepID=H2ZND4_CIOSA